MAAVLRVVGPPGSGKTLLIVSLAEALQSRGQRVATVAPRRDGATVVALSNGARVTLPGGGLVPTLARLQEVVPALDPSVTIILAEDYDAPDDAAFPAIALGPRGAAPRADAIASLASEEIEATFADLGPGATNGLVDVVEQQVLGIAPPPVEAPASRPVPTATRRGLRSLFHRPR